MDSARVGGNFGGYTKKLQFELPQEGLGKARDSEEMESQRLSGKTGPPLRVRSRVLQ